MIINNFVPLNSNVKSPSLSVVFFPCNSIPEPLPFLATISDYSISLFSQNHQDNQSCLTVTACWMILKYFTIFLLNITQTRWTFFFGHIHKLGCLCSGLNDPATFIIGSLNFHKAPYKKFPDQKSLFLRPLY